MRIFYFFLLFSISFVSYSASIDPIRDRACPDAWIFNDKAIPVTNANTNPWGEGTEDKLQAKTHLSTATIVKTIDAVPVTSDDLVDDLLTVASECLVYRNMLVDGAKYYPPSPVVIRNVTTGFIPASIF